MESIVNRAAWVWSLGSAVLLVLAPVLGAGIVPRWISQWRFGISWTEWQLLRIAGALLGCAGAAVPRWIPG